MMSKYQYTIEDARREIKECIDEGYGFDYIRIFINDLVRGKDITNDDRRVLMHELVEKQYFDGFGTGGFRK